MSELQYHTMDDKAGQWGDGPWVEEPDKLQWTDSATGYPCLIVRNRMGALCGYVGVAEGHPYFGKHYDEVSVNVHGGLTFASLCQEGPEDHAICHIPAPGQPDHVWWFGFDCSHGMDYSPSIRASLRGTKYPRLPFLEKLNMVDDIEHGVYGPAGDDGVVAMFKETYKTVAYVTAECRDLAKQLKAAESV